MKSRAIIPLVIGLGVGLFAIKMFVSVLQKAKGSSTSGTVSVVYAKENIEPTLEITQSMVEVRQVPKEGVPNESFHQTEEVVGRVTAWPVLKGSIIGPMQLAPKDTPPGMAVRIQDGFRAVAVKTDESAGVAGWLQPGSRVDVITLMPNPEVRGESISRTILQNVEVLAVGQDLGIGGAAAITKTVTLLVKPEDVPRLHLAETKGKIRLSMRNPHDTEYDKPTDTTDNDLLALGNTRNKRAAAPGKSILSAFFGGQAQVRSEQTDKENVVKPAPAPAQPWPVELVRGEADVEVLWFDGDKKGSRRLDGTGNRRSGSPRRAAGPAVPPSILPDVKAVPGVNAADPGQPQVQGASAATAAVPRE